MIREKYPDHPILLTFFSPSGFEVRKDYLDQYDVQQAGGKAHEEYWIPAEDIDAFNAAIVGTIEVVRSVPE